MAEKSIQERLRNVQMSIKVPKNQKNSFGGYNYRSCEDILEAVKPILALNGLTLIIGDNIIQLGDRYYIEATATVYDDQGKSFSVRSMAREEETKKGMDASQITGSASSYARKYALNGLFAIDDTKDADTQDNRSHDNARPYGKPSTKKADGPVATDKQKALIAKKLAERGVAKEEMVGWLSDQYGINSEMSMEDASMIIEDLLRDN